jgi:type II secretory pathway component GspD/PulD (secretin)
LKKTVIILAVVALCVPLLRAADEAPVRVFVLKHRRVEEAALLVRPFLSESASVTLTRKLNAMTVTDRPEKLDQIGKVIAAFDVAPRSYSFAVKLVKARADVPAGSIAQEIGGIGAKLKSLFQFNDYALIDSAVLRGTEGSVVRYQLGSE